MPPAAWLIIVIVFWVISSANKAKKAKAAAGQKTAARQAPKPPAQPKKQEAPPAQPAPEHRAAPLEAHMHTPVMGIEGEGTEGEDCCHEYMLDTPEEAEETPAEAPLTDAGADDRAQALLQGVIFSEILGRRPQKRYGRRCA